MRSRRIVYWIVALVVAVAAGLAGCGPSDKSDSAATSQGVIRLGALVPMTGDNALPGLVPALNLAVKEANDAGGVLGHRVEAVTADDMCDPQTAVNRANEMVKQDITVYVGGYCSSATVPTLTIFHGAGVPMIIPAASATDLVAPGYDSLFLLSGTTAIEAGRAVGLMPKLGAHRAVVVDDGTSFSQTMARATEDAAHNSGGQVTVVRNLQLSQGANRYDRLANQVASAGGDIVFYTGYYTEAGKLIRDLRAAGYHGKVMLSDGGAQPGVFRDVSPAAIEGTYALSLPAPQFEPGLADWSARYRAIAGRDPGPFSMQTYDAARLALNAIQRAGTLDHAAVRKALSDTTPNDIGLLSGVASFSPDGTQRDVRFLLLRAHNGTFVLDSRIGG